MTGKNIYVSYALVQPQFRADFIGRKTDTSLGKNRLITNFCNALIYISQNENEERSGMIRSWVLSYKLYNYPILNILVDSEENKFTRYVKGCCGLAINPCVTRGSFSYYPTPNKVLFHCKNKYERSPVYFDGRC
ncbi:hypothetical protein HHI36_022499 [Cryptolaemus montrouzieri]|uniref:Uncharacterized protein n=1 Tax=Cryptolaemus montrouzieri TaxID=559131 RepID=A0ABD2N0U9_9CUCU